MPIGSSVFIVINGYDGSSTNPQHWEALARDYVHLTIYLACRERADEIDDHPSNVGSIGLKLTKTHLWSIYSLHRLVRFWAYESTDYLCYRYLLHLMETARMARELNGGTYGPRAIRRHRNW